MKNIKETKIIFMGTPIFAAAILEDLIANKFNIIGVVSQPDKKTGRKQIVTPTPTKEVALKYNIPVIQPNKIKTEFNFLEEYQPELIITAAYGQIVPSEVLDYPKYGCINVHGSLLPKYRGGAPIHYAIMNGDTKTGVTIMEMVNKMDAGNIISQEEFPINNTDNLQIVHDNMIEVAKNLLKETLPAIINESAPSIVQDEDKVVFSPNISKEQEKIDWSKPAMDIYNLIRALNPWPVSYCLFNNERFKIFNAELIVTDNEKYQEGTPGEIVKIDNDGIQVACLNGNLNITEFQIFGKKRINIKEYINGNTKIKTGLFFN